MKKHSLRGKVILFTAKMIFMSAFSYQAHAGLEHACWSDPLQTVELTSGRLVGIGQPNKGFEGSIAFERSPVLFTAKCNNSDNFERHGIFVEGGLGPYFVPSVLNNGSYRLPDEVDVKVRIYAGENWVPYPVKISDRKIVSAGPYWLQPGQEIVYNNFSSTLYAHMTFVGLC